MAALTVFPHRLKDRLKHLSPALLRLVGLRLLTKVQTEELLRPFQISYAVKPAISLAGISDVADTQKVLFQPKVVETEPDFVWDYPNTNSRAELLRSGNLNICNKFLDTDFGNRALLNDLFAPDRRLVERYPIVIAPWSHYWGGYYDFLLFVAAKLARIKRVLPHDLFAQAAVSYPLFQTSFETELLSLIGISPDRVFDSRKHAMHFDRCLLANNSSWFYPAAADVLALKSIVELQLKPADSSANKRLYISRTGRRKVINEDALITMLLQYGFEVVEDKPRSIIEQIELYRSASFIIGPHGASFANLLWCRAGTQLIELFAPNYRPEYFRYLAHVLSIRYAGYCFGPVADSHYSFVDSDIEVSIDEVERGVVRVLTQAS